MYGAENRDHECYIGLFALSTLSIEETYVDHDCCHHVLPLSIFSAQQSGLLARQFIWIIQEHLCTYFWFHETNFRNIA